MLGVVVFQRDNREKLLATDPEITDPIEVVVNTTVRVRNWKDIGNKRLPDIVISNMGGIEYEGVLSPNATWSTGGGFVGHFVRG